MPVNIRKISYAGWPNCYQISDGIVDVIATGDVGLRLVRCGFVDESNLFVEIPEHTGQTGGDQWKIYGGHRLWHSPETLGRCYNPDNSPIEVRTLTNGLHLRQPIEPNTGFEKEIMITLEPASHTFFDLLKDFYILKRKVNHAQNESCLLSAN